MQCMPCVSNIIETLCINRQYIYDIHTLFIYTILHTVSAVIRIQTSGGTDRDTMSPPGPIHDNAFSAAPVS